MSSRLFAPSFASVVKFNDDFRRIVSLPRRVIDMNEAAATARELTEIFRQPWGTQELRPLQGQGLLEFGLYGGLFAALRVGAGKTLLSLLLSSVSDCHRPLLLQPASLVEKTLEEARALKQHWKIPHIKIITYDLLGREQAHEALNDFKPDLIICDECHALKDTGASVTCKVVRYFKANPTTKFAMMTGTISKRSILDYAHLLRMCLGPANAPVPMGANDLEIWADALDERKGQTKRSDPKGFFEICNTEERKIWTQDERRAARMAYRRRLTETPGVLASWDSPIDAKLIIREVQPPKSKVLETAFKQLRVDGVTPDDWPVAGGVDIYRHAQELALGFYYVWDPRPPKYWLEARSAWYRAVRQILSRSQRYDSPGHVKNDMLRGRLELIPELTDWLDVKDDFTPNTVPRWLDDSVIRYCAEWIEKYRGIVWTEHTWFATELAKYTKVPYYGRRGMTESGQSILRHRPGFPMIASMRSNSKGRNLQAWNHNLFTACPPNALQCEQVMGRTHRDGQLEKEVFFDILMFCSEHIGNFWQAMRDAEFQDQTQGTPSKLLIAEHDIPEPIDVAMRPGHRWVVRYESEG